MEFSYQNARLGRQLTHGLAYTPYGFLGLSNDPPFVGFAGQWREAMTGLYPLGNGYRSYSSIIMRLITPDGLSPFDKGGLNAYTYCGGDPVNYADPSGQFNIKISASGAVKRLGLKKATGHSRLLNDANYPQSMKPFIKQLDEYGKSKGSVNALLFNHEGAAHRLYRAKDGLVLQPVESSIFDAYQPLIYAQKGNFGLGVIDGHMPMDVKGYRYITNIGNHPPSYAALFPASFDLPPSYEGLVAAVRCSED